MSAKKANKYIFQYKYHQLQKANKFNDFFKFKYES